MTGRTISHYRILEKLGEGGMGEVYKAFDERLGRTVAIKFSKQGFSDRFAREARNIAALNHPHICSLYDFDTQDGEHFLVMEFVEGQRLAAPQPLSKALELAIQIADALRAAHVKGIIHRDLKPANILVTAEGQVKVLDFGLAKHAAATPPESPQTTTATLTSDDPSLTGKGVVLGTTSYMSPEQVEGKPLDVRSDIFSFGAVLYELLTGQRAFQGDSVISTMSAILRATPERASKVRPEIPRQLEAILNRCLEKERERRYPSAAGLHKDLVDLQSRIAASRTGFRALLKPRVAVPAAIAILVLAAAAAWYGVRASRVSWALNTALPEIARLADRSEYTKAFELAARAGEVISGNKALEELWPRISLRITLETDPPGAAISMKPYEELQAPWKPAGRSPLKEMRIPRGYFRWKISLPGYEDLEAGGPPVDGPMAFRLVRLGSPESGMSCLPAGTFNANMAGFGRLGPWPMEEFCIDKFEVTNRRFKQFVDAGGYRNREFWKHLFVQQGRTLPWEQALSGFVDSSGRPGPATWEGGAYPTGQDNLPVGGISWYEAAAYAEYAGKSLPTLYHWYHAAGLLTNSVMVTLSNYSGKGAASVGSNAGVSLRGVYDLAGNHREWAWSETHGRRYSLGGAWNDPTYLVAWMEPRDPFDRSPGNGFRCAVYRDRKTPPERYAGAVDRPWRDFSREKPASDETFRVLKEFYPRESSPLDSKLESEDASAEHWTKLRVSYSAGYGDERLPAFLFLPKNAAPPYQVVLFFPGAGALQVRNSGIPYLVNFNAIDFILSSGRAVLYPIYKGTYERNAGLVTGSHSRENVAWWVSEVHRSVDYLESRPDIDRARIAYAGVSWGARLSSVFMALEPRIKAGVLFAGGYNLTPRAPEADEFNYTPRVKAPVLMINGRYDFVFPYQASSKIMFERLGTPKDRKRQVVIDSGHDVVNYRAVVTREALDWLDRYLGPVKTR